MPQFTPIEWLILIIVGLSANEILYRVKLAKAAREGIRWRFRVTASALAFYLLIVVLMTAVGQTPWVSVLVGVLAGLLIGRSTPKRSRNIPAKTRREVIRRFEEETGLKYNPRKHHIDHIMPFARGGSHTLDNLRIVQKRRNLRKGKRLPKMEEFSD